MKSRLYSIVFLTTLLFTCVSVSAQTISLNTTDVRCNGSADGSISVTVTGGMPPFNYQWSIPTSVPEITGLSPGTYTVTVTDASGSTATASAAIGEPAPLGVEPTVTAPRCQGEASGSIALSVTGGTTPYSYAWTGGPHSPNLNGATAGPYAVVVTDANGCSAEAAAVVPEPPVLSWGAGTTQPACSGIANGAIDLQPLGGTAPYTIFWSNGSTAEDQNGLLAGSYSATIVDAHNCLVPATFNLSAGQHINFSINSLPAACNGTGGQISVTSVSGGTPPYSYAWSDGNATAVVGNLLSGTYTVTITDANGCSVTASRDVSPLVTILTPVVIQCAYNISATVFSGQAPYTYVWSNGNTTSQLTGASPGPYSVTVGDATGCISVSTIITASLPELVAGITPITDVCNGGLQAVGYNFTGASYLWSNGSTSSRLTNIPAGTYTVTVTSQQGCTVSASITTAQPFTAATITTGLTATQPGCSDPNGGDIKLINPAGSALPLSFLWSTGATATLIDNLPEGAYTVTISDANGCTRAINENLVNAGPPVITPSTILPVGCVGSGIIDISVSGGAPPYIYGWSDGSITEDIQVFTPGVYMVTVSGSNGCSTTGSYVILQDPLPILNIYAISNDCNQATLQSAVTGNGPFVYAWTGPAGFTSQAPNITVVLSGAYTLTITNSVGCTSVFTYDVQLGSSGLCGGIEGSVVYDLDSSCTVNAGEFGLWGWLVRAGSATDTVYGTTDLEGHYLIHVPVGTYVLEALPPNGLWQACPLLPSATVTENETIQADTILVNGVVPCPALSVSIGTSILRRCFSTNSYQIQYCNLGTIAAQAAYILVTLDPFLTPGVASAPYVDLGGGVLRFDLGTVSVGACGTFYLQVTVSCAAVIGQTHCTEAHIYPDGDCLPPSTFWSGASLRVTSQCQPDSVRFTIKNMGSGNMESASDYIVVEDAVMLMQAQLQLASGDSTVLAFPANGSTWRIQVEQVPYHPGLSAPALSVEGCSNAAPFTTGYVTQYPNDEAAPSIDIDCTQNVGSYDPNDKQGFPVGYGQEHYIRPGTELEYMIRFQNTGTDTAFTVRVVDTLSSWLDPATIRPGVSSHDYQFNLTGPGIAEFLFENILLPDSNVNQAGSNGFLKFSIIPKADAPLETLIENTANIYFDFNEAIVTNTTRHRLGENFLSVGLWQPQRPEYEVLVSPNPFAETARLEIKGLRSLQPVHLQIVDLQGRIVVDEDFSGSSVTLRKTGLPPGMYLFKLDQKGGLIGSGKLVVKE